MMYLHIMKRKASSSVFIDIGACALGGLLRCSVHVMSVRTTYHLPESHVQVKADVGIENNLCQRTDETFHFRFCCFFVDAAWFWIGSLGQAFASVGLLADQQTIRTNLLCLLRCLLSHFDSSSGVRDIF